MKKNIVITISENYLDKVNYLTDIFRKDGMLITRSYDFGVITGNVEENIIPKLRKHKEIISLKEDSKPQIAPPNSEIQ